MMDFLTNKVLMVRPVAFTYNEETGKDNLYQKNDSQDRVILEKKAEEEFDNLVEKLRKESIEVLVLQDTLTPHTPDSIFPNNWFSTHEDEKVVFYPMYAENRRLERTDKIFDFVKDKSKIEKIDFTKYENEGKFLEGTGSMCLDRKNKIAYANISKRTDKELFDKFCEKLGYKGISFSGSQIVDGKKAPIYHTNVMLTVGEKYAIIYLDAIEDPKERELVKNSLESTGKKIIKISGEQTKNFLGNAIELRKKDGSKILVMSQRAYNALIEEQKNIIEESAKIVYSDIPTIENYGGGSARCMIAEFFLD